MKRRTLYKALLGGVILWICIVLTPLFSIFRASFLTGTHLIIFTNEAELRPCGGFITGFMKLSIFPPMLTVDNVYSLPIQPLNTVPEPINRIAPALFFWDTTLSEDLDTCTNMIHNAYQTLTNESIKHMWLMDFASIEAVLEVLGDVYIPSQETHMNHKNAFGMISRTVANTDRHNINSLNTRKNILSEMLPQLIWKIIMSPHKWHRITDLIASRVHNGHIYNTLVSDKKHLTDNDFSIIHYNLGAGKTSRKLDTTLKIRIIEADNNILKGAVEVNVMHNGLPEDPLSMQYNGVMDIIFPAKLGIPKQRINLQIDPTKEHIYRKEFSIDTSFLTDGYNVLSPRGHTLHIINTVILTPQQSIDSLINTNSSDVLSAENTIIERDSIINNRREYRYKINTDAVKPYATFHQIVPYNNERTLEIHFSEPIKIDDNTMITLESKELDEIVMKDNMTLLMRINNTLAPTNKPLKLEIHNVYDMSNNRIDSNILTVMDR